MLQLLKIKFSIKYNFQAKNINCLEVLKHYMYFDKSSLGDTTISLSPRGQILSLKTVICPGLPHLT